MSKRRSLRHFRDMPVDVKGLEVDIPASIGTSHREFVDTLMRIRRVFFKTSQTSHALGTILDLCIREYRKGGQVLTHQKIMEFVEKTSSLAHRLHFPHASVEETKSRLAPRVQWWDAWLQDEAGQMSTGSVASDVIQESVPDCAREAFALQTEIDRLEVTEYAIYKVFQGPEPRTTKKIINNLRTSARSVEKLKRALKRAKAEGRKTRIKTGASRNEANK